MASLAPPPPPHKYPGYGPGWGQPRPNPARLLKVLGFEVFSLSEKKVLFSVCCYNYVNYIPFIQGNVNSMMAYIFKCYITLTNNLNVSYNHSSYQRTNTNAGYTPINYLANFRHKMTKKKTVRSNFFPVWLVK